MIHVFVLFCINVGRFVTCEETVTLDLSSPDSSLFSLADDLIHGVGHRAFVPKDGYSLVSVVDNGEIIWTATDTQEGCTGAYLFYREGYSSLLSVYTRGAGDETFCFEKNGSVWKTVDKRYFEDRLRSMKEFSAPSEEHREDEQETKVTEQRVSLEEPAESVEVSTPEESNRKELAVDKVEDPKSTEPEHSPEASTPLAFEEPNDGSEPVGRLEDSKIELKFSDDPLENPSDRATGTESESNTTDILPFEDAMRELEYFRKVLLTKTPLPVVDEFTLDIAQKSKNHFIKLVDDVDNGYKQKKYSPLYGTYKRTIDGTFTKVVDGSTVIWTAKLHERCGYVSCLAHEKFPPLLTIAVCGRSDFVAYDRFIKDDSGWRTITVEEFDQKMEERRKKNDKEPPGETIYS